MSTITVGRRLPDGSGAGGLEMGGDYAYEVDANGVPRIWFLLPGARDADAFGGIRSVHTVTEPPWSFRFCADGSIEVRASIACGRGSEGGEYWHGWLDEGHLWRSV